MSEGRIEQIGTPFGDLQLPGDGLRGVVRRDAQPCHGGRHRCGRLAASRSMARRSEPRKAVTEAGAGGRVTLALRPEGIALGRRRQGCNRLRGTIEDINFLGSIVRSALRHRRRGRRRATGTSWRWTPSTSRTCPAAGRRAVTVSFPPEACFVLGSARDGDAGRRRGRRRGVTRPTARRDRPRRLRQGRHAHRLRRACGAAGRLTLAGAPGDGDRAVGREPLFAMLGLRRRRRDAVLPGGGLAATPMARLRERTRDVLVADGPHRHRGRGRPRRARGTRRTRSAWPIR